MSVRQIGIVNQVLTNVTRGYRNPGFIAESLFPTVLVDKEGVTVPKFGKDSFKVYNTERAPRADSNVMTPSKDGSIDIVLKEHDLVYPVDYREQQAAMYNRNVRAAKTVKDSLLLTHEKTCADLATDVSQYGVSHKLALSSGSQLENITSPSRLFKEGVEAIRSDIGVHPNTIIFGGKPWATFAEHPEVLARLSATGLKVLTEQLAAELLEIPKVKVGRAVYVTDGGQSVDIWGNVVILAYVPDSATEDGRSEEEPSYGYTFRLRDKAMVVDEYPSVGGKVNNVRCTDIRKAAILGADAAFLFTNVTGDGFSWAIGGGD